VFDPEYLSKRKTKNSQERIEETGVRVDIVDDIIADEAEDDIVISLDDADDIAIDDDEDAKG
jgi:hypothetical protein